MEAVGGLSKVKVSRHLAKVIEPLGDKLGCDLAVLAVEGELTDIPPLKLGVIAHKGNLFAAAGFYQDDTNTRKLAEISGKLGGTQIIVDREGDRTPAWNLEISDDSEHDLKAGYSGSPAVDKTSGYVFGVVAQLISQGKGLAISIEALEKVWWGMPQNLISKSKPDTGGSKGHMNPAKQRQIERLKKELNLAENQCKELHELIELTDVEINENRNDLTRQHMLNMRKERYKQELKPYEQKVEMLLTEIGELG
ncbi:S1 family peptidase [Nostoc sp.]|uniref:S1 family peptidase n=1 Tax=Nostoc sp. TaxID=1180 RepID=UPI002FFB4653